MASMLTEVGDLRRLQELLAGRNRLLEQFVGGATCDEMLERLVSEAERLFVDMRCSVLLVDRERRCLRFGWAASLPRSFAEAVEGAPIGVGLGTGGAATAGVERLIVEDVEQQAQGEPLRAFARRMGFRAVWSQPIVASTGEVLGAFALYGVEPRRPDAFELDFVLRSAQLACVALEHERAKGEVLASEERFRQLAESIREVFWLTDWRSKRTLYISPAYEEVWGRSCQSLLDDPKSWAYDIHPEDHDRAVEAFRSAGEEPYEVEYRIVRADGSMRWIYDRAFPILDEDGQVYRIAGLSEDITDRKEVEEALRRAHSALDERTRLRLRSLTSELLLAEERERRTLALDLHDGLNQYLSLARMKLGGAQSDDPKELRETIEAVRELLDRANQAARSLTFQLSPPLLHDLGFEPAVQWLVEDVQQSYDLSITLDELGEELALDDRVKLLLFRAVRELLINVAKHARASQARVHLSTDGHFLTISVEDDGVAFDTENRSSRGLGLRGIEERLSNLGGQMIIHSRPDTGTKITLAAPLAQERP